jgi:hypothetical protein
VIVERCAKCVLPSSLPGSDFDANGVCSWCRSGFPNHAPKGRAALDAFVTENRSKNGGADCMVGISGGKDSSYVVIKMKQDLGLRVEAFTYAHDGLTDFALDNAKRVCRALDVPHHVVSLPDHEHLKSFRAFFQAWLNGEDPVAAAMTCVACKHLHILGTKLAKERNIPIVVWSLCPLETPPFIPTQAQGTGKAASSGMIGLSLTLAKSTVSEPAFRRAMLSHFSTCLFGCVAFRPDSGYLQRRYPSVKHLHYFEYMGWNGPEIVAALKEETGWGVPAHIKSDWHSDCVFNVFKEFMFQTMFGASYTDAFLSNQIRYGLLTREQAWEELVRSKRFFGDALPEALEIVGLAHLLPRCDRACFEIE